ncbi:MAG: DUF998 domain-containing protein [Ruminococcus sp.]|nr:DUF998 domain-containing protein [Ruminococcus sp.]
MKDNTLIKKFGLLGVVALLSYTAAVIFAPLDYPGYDWMSQAVSDLSAENSPSRALWNTIAAPYNKCTLVCLMSVCLYVQGRLTKPLRAGICLFTIMSWISGIGYAMFPLSESGNPDKFQDIMHTYVVTPLVVMLSIASLVTIIVGGCKNKQYRFMAAGAGIALGMMFLGPIGMAALPKAYFGIAERFSVFAATGFTCFLGICLFKGFGEKDN